MTDMSFLIITQSNIAAGQAEIYRDYIQRTIPIMAKYEAQVVFVGPSVDGTPATHHYANNAVLSFPNRAAFDQFIADPEYAAANPLLKQAVADYHTAHVMANVTEPKPQPADLIEAMPLLARHAGEWVGTYRILDEDGTLVDQHASHLIINFTPGAMSYTQTNRYTWSDGREIEYEFTGVYENGRVIYDTDRISGSAWEADDKTIVLKFTYKDDPTQYVYEYLHLSADGQHRTRQWHWFNANGEVFRRTLIKEKRI